MFDVILDIFGMSKIVEGAISKKAGVEKYKSIFISNMGRWYIEIKLRIIFEYLVEFALTCLFGGNLK